MLMVMTRRAVEIPELSALERLGVGVRRREVPFVRRRAFVMMRARWSPPLPWQGDYPTERLEGSPLALT